MLGRTISHYQVERRLGAGGMGEVFLARDLALGRMAAVKVLPPSLTADTLRRKAVAAGSNEASAAP